MQQATDPTSPCPLADRRTSTWGGLATTLLPITGRAGAPGLAWWLEISLEAMLACWVWVSNKGDPMAVGRGARGPQGAQWIAFPGALTEPHVSPVAVWLMMPETQFFSAHSCLPPWVMDHSPAGTKPALGALCELSQQIFQQLSEPLLLSFFRGGG